MSLFKSIVLTLVLSLLVSCGGEDSTSGDLSDGKSPAIQKIKLYASDSNNPAPTIQDYRDAGVSGLEDIDIDKLNEKVASLTIEDVDTVDELDAITAELGINISPFSRAGVDQTVVENTVVTLNGSASSDSDGTITTWLWIESGTTLSTSQSFSKSDFSVGTHTITLQVTDNSGVSHSDTVVITVTANVVVNIAPVANAGADQTVVENTAVTLNGSASSDSDGTITTWLWIESGTTLSTSQSFSKSDFSVGTHTITLQVTDNSGVSHSDTVVITVTAKAVLNIAPIANAGVDQTVVENTAVTLRSASSDSDGTITTWLWIESGTTLSTSQSFSKSDFSVGTHTITLQVTDNSGVSHSDTVVITVTAKAVLNIAPVANAGAGQTVLENTAVTLNGSASSDSDGTITTWLWIESGTTLSTSQSFSKSDFSVGTHTITLQVTDNSGVSHSDTVVIIVTTEVASGAISIAPISDVSTPEYAYTDVPGYVSADKDEPGHYTSITPALTGSTPVGRVVYTLGGADAEEFTVNKKTGLLTLDYKDFENPTDSNKDNIYEVTLKVTDEAGNTDNESWNVTVTDVVGDTATRHIISMNGSSLVRVKAGQAFVDPGVTLVPFDNGANVTLSSKIVSDHVLDPQLGSIDTNNPNDRVYHILYSAIDSVNSALSAPQLARTIIVEAADDFASLGAIVTASVTGIDNSQKTFISLEEDYVQNALYYAKNHGGGVVSLSSGVHYYKRQLVIYSDTTLQGTVSNGVNTTTLKLMDFAIRKAWANSSYSFGNSHPLIVNASANDNYYQYIDDKTEQTSNNISIKNIILNGNRERQRAWKSAGFNNSAGILVENTTGLTVDNVLILNTLSDGVSTNSSSNIGVTNSQFRLIGHSAVFFIHTTDVITDNLTMDVLANSGIRFYGGKNFTITNNHIFCTTNGGNFGIQISNNYSGGNAVENVLIEGNIIRHTPYAGIGIYTSSINDVIRDVTIQNNIIYSSASVVPNMGHFVAKEANGRIHEGGGIVTQHVKALNINNNTIFNNQGSAIRLDNRFYIADGTDKDWNDLEDLDRMIGKTASITNNILVANDVSGYDQYSDASAFGIEKRVALYCGVNQNEECAGTTVTTANNVFSLNHSGRASSNIALSSTDNAIFTGFVDAQAVGFDIREVSYNFATETKPDFNLVGIADPQVGASKSILQKNLDTYDEYRSYFIPLAD